MKKETKTSEAGKDQPAVAAGHETPSASATMAEGDACLEELRTQAAKAAEHWDRLLRTTADFDNFKKRAAREKQESIKYANESLLEKFMPVMDSFDAALQAAKTNDGEIARALQHGVEMVFQQFKQVLKDAGLEEVDATGELFDPNMHEAIAAQESAEMPEGRVLQQIRKGYKLRERLLRPASVIVAKAPETGPKP